MLIYYILLLAAASHIYGYNEPRIVNGTITSSDLFQFAVRVHTKGSRCTGSIISQRHVLTAAHCINEKSLKIEHDRFKVYLKIPYFAEVRPAGRVHDKLNMPLSIKAFVPTTWTQWPWNDIAILEFPEGTDFGIEPVKLAKDYFEKEGDEVYITGFGYWWMKGNKTSGGSKVLRHTKVSILNDCIGTLKICGGNKTHQGLPGDSGGPMLINQDNQWYQTGVHAGGPDFDIRARVSSYCNFIEEVTKNEAKCESIYPDNYLNGQLLPLEHFEPIYKGQSTPFKLFDFVVPLYNYYYNQGCTATVISKRYLLTSAFCVFREWLKNENKKAKITQHSSYKTITGKLFPDLRSKNVQSNLKNDPMDVTAYFPSNYVWPWKHNLAIVEFPEGTDFGIEPVTLPKNYFQVYLEEVIIAGYGKYKIKSNMLIKGSPPMLQHSNASFALNSDWKITLKDNENLMKDEGGPTLIDRNGKFYQIGVNFHRGTTNGSRTFVSTHCNFIEEVTKKEVKCESILPIYENLPPESTTTILPVISSAVPFVQKLSSVAPKMDHFQMAALSIALLILLYI